MPILAADADALYDSDMIASLRGAITNISHGFAIVEVGGVGYKVFLAEDTALAMSVGSEVTLFTYMAVRETALELFGFQTETEQNFFELLLEVPGVGPRSALNILSLADVHTLKEAIASKNASYLTRVSGIGKKSAEKIVITLQDKVGIASGDLTGEADAQEALRALGYSPKEAREALRAVPHEVTEIQERVREALKILGK
jgi:Holliday junction DNA helicase RuvA